LAVATKSGNQNRDRKNINGKTMEIYIDNEVVRFKNCIL